jgi:hypothetical protein
MVVMTTGLREVENLLGGGGWGTGGTWRRPRAGSREKGERRSR